MLSFGNRAIAPRFGGARLFAQLERVRVHVSPMHPSPAFGSLFFLSHTTRFFSVRSLSTAAPTDRRLVDAELCKTGEELAKLVQAACTAAREAAEFKTDRMTWGVTRVDDPRMTTAYFGDYKSAQRRETEAKLIEYMQAPSKPRAPGLSEYEIALTVAAPGTGKTRLLDDALRVPLDTTHFAHFLRLAITFNGKYGGAFAHPVATRMLREFFCGSASEHAFDVLREINGALLSMFPNKDADVVARTVLDALEALYFQQRGGVLGRSVLLIDEVSKVEFVPAGREPQESAIYRTVLIWVDRGGSREIKASRRGAVFTGLTAESWTPWAPSGRQLVLLPLGLFDVWDEEVQRAIAMQAKSIWPDAQLPARLWPLLVATGGRPRDVSGVLERLSASGVLLGRAQPHDRELLNALFVPNADVLFRRYLLPSMLGVTFDAYDVSTKKVTQFGRGASSVALLNSDQLAIEAEAVPAVSLAHVGCVRLTDADLFFVLEALISSTIFCKLDGSGKDFERVWALLVHSVLRLQHAVRYNERFWPSLAAGVALGGPARPTAEEIDVFATSTMLRIEALFARPHSRRVFEAPGATVHRKISLKQREPPTLALWKDVWTATVEAGSEAPKDWPHISLDVEWRPSTIVLFENRSSAIDFMLLVGEKGGTADNEPHVYMFQSQAPGADSVRLLKEKLDELFGASHESTHVLRRAGIRLMRQVTLCVAAINLGDTIDLNALDAPFNVVLFDAADFRALGGAAFRNQHAVLPQSGDHKLNR